jgi:Protein of unknown function (DUF2889)
MPWPNGTARLDRLWHHVRLMDSRFAADFADIDLACVHERAYAVKAYRKTSRTLLLRGVVHDQAPAGVTIPGDTEPFDMHHMVIDLEVDMTTTEITAATVRMDTHPHEQCVSITTTYDQLVGLFVGRGYTHKVRELFGGPRGCTHVLALLQAMAPVVMQSRWPMARMVEPGTQPLANPTMMSPEDRKRLALGQMNTCHVWAEDGEMVADTLAGRPMKRPEHIDQRLRAMGVDPDNWN